jgi:hypothetical protein
LSVAQEAFIALQIAKEVFSAEVTSQAKLAILAIPMFRGGAVV